MFITSSLILTKATKRTFFDLFCKKTLPTIGPDTYLALSKKAPHQK